MPVTPSPEFPVCRNCSKQSHDACIISTLQPVPGSLLGEEHYVPCACPCARGLKAMWSK